MRVDDNRDLHRLPMRDTDNSSARSCRSPRAAESYCDRDRQPSGQGRAKPETLHRPPSFADHLGSIM
jgi:hypothetical protein